MKKIILLSAALIGIVSASNAATVVIKQAGGPEGYSKISEHHDDKGNSTLTCSDPGFDECKFTVAPGGNIYRLAMSYVDGEIEIGNINGQTILNGHTIEWNGTDLYNYILEIEKNTP